MRISTMRSSLILLMTAATCLAANITNTCKPIPNLPKIEDCSEYDCDNSEDTNELYAPSNRPDLLEDFSDPCDIVHTIFVGHGQDLTSDDYGITVSQWEKLGLDKKRNHSEGMIHHVKYPFSSIGYDVSIQEGVAETKRILHKLTVGSTCLKPNRIVMMGYGQGAQIVQDTLCGGEASPNVIYTAEERDCLGAPIDYVSQVTQDQVVAVVQISDPRKNLESGIKQVGTSKNNGVFPRPVYDSNCSKSTLAKFRTYCDTNDPLCDRGYDMQMNANYYKNKYKQDPYKFIAGQVKDFDNNKGLWGKDNRWEKEDSTKSKVPKTDKELEKERMEKEKKKIEEMKKWKEDEKNMDREMLRQAGMVPDNSGGYTSSESLEVVEAAVVGTVAWGFVQSDSKIG